MKNRPDNSGFNGIKMKTFTQLINQESVPDLKDANQVLMDILGLAPLSPNQLKDARKDYIQYKRDSGDDISFESFLALTK